MEAAEKVRSDKNANSEVMVRESESGREQKNEMKTEEDILPDESQATGDTGLQGMPQSANTSETPDVPGSVSMSETLDVPGSVSVSETSDVPESMNEPETANVHVAENEPESANEPVSPVSLYIPESANITEPTDTAGISGLQEPAGEPETADESKPAAESKPAEETEPADATKLFGENLPQSEKGQQTGPVPEHEGHSESAEREESGVQNTESSAEKRILKAVAASFFTVVLMLFGIYAGVAKYFDNRFFPGSVINGIDVSFKTVEEVKEIMASEFENYRLRLKQRGGKSEYIKASEIGLTYGTDEEVRNLKEPQKGYLWVSALFNKEGYNMTLPLVYDDELLKKRVENLSCLDPANATEPENPTIKYVNGEYVIIDGKAGNKVDKDILYSQVVNAVTKGARQLDLDAAGCYVRPRYNSKSKKVVEARNTLNKYISSQITYNFGDVKTVLDGSEINRWLIIDKEYNITFNQQKVRDFINRLSDIYGTAGKPREFLTSTGETVVIKGGDYGQYIDVNKEMNRLISEIKQGKKVVRSPEIAGSSDIGDTYVEISLSRQHIWFYKNGKLIVEGDVVTGNVSRNFSTRKGIFRLKSKSRNVILRGPDYSVHVDFWMPYDGGIGIHDAKWRSAFGGKIYLTNGSHGCVNCPYDVAKKIYENISVGTPVICY